MKCVKCGRLTSNEVDHCVYCGNEQVIPPGTPMNVQIPSFESGPGKLLVSFKDSAMKIMADTEGKIDTSPVKVNTDMGGQSSNGYPIRFDFNGEIVPPGVMTDMGTVPNTPENWLKYIDLGGKKRPPNHSPVRPRERHAVCVRVGAHHVLDMIGFGLRAPSGYVYMPEFPQLPEGTVVVAVNANFMSNTIDFIVEHPSFAAVPEGMPAPEWPDLLKANFRVVRVGDDNPNVLHFDTSGMTADERDRLEDAITKMQSGVEPMILLPRGNPSVWGKTSDGYELLLRVRDEMRWSFAKFCNPSPPCQFVNDRGEVVTTDVPFNRRPHPWSLGTVERPAIKADLFVNRGQENSLLSDFKSVLFVSPWDANQMMKSEEMVNYCASVRHPENVLDRANKDPKYTFPNGLLRTIYGVHVVIESDRPSGKVMLWNGVRATAIDFDLKGDE